MAMSVLPSTMPGLAKRKLASAPGADAVASVGGKRQRVDRVGGPQLASGLPSEPHESLLAELRPKYDVATFSVISSTSIAKRIDQILAHLSRFHPVDMAVLPGVALVHARAHDAAKMVSITELIRRKIHDGGQKWYQYNRLYEVEAAAPPEAESVIEETVLPAVHRPQGQQTWGAQNEKDRNDDDFESSAAKNGAPSVFERAALGQPKSDSVLYMSIFLSRVPIPELRAKSFMTAQSNSDSIEQQRKRQYE